jgi:hypothetical protein
MITHAVGKAFLEQASRLIGPAFANTLQSAK